MFARLFSTYTSVLGGVILLGQLVITYAILTGLMTQTVDFAMSYVSGVNQHIMYDRHNRVNESIAFGFLDGASVAFHMVAGLVSAVSPLTGNLLLDGVECVKQSSISAMVKMIAYLGGSV